MSLFHSIQKKTVFISKSVSPHLTMNGVCQNLKIEGSKPKNFLKEIGWNKVHVCLHVKC